MLPGDDPVTVEQTSRLELDGGRFAELRTFITFGLRRAVQAALDRRRNGTLEERLRAAAEIIVAMVVDWNLVGPTGEIAAITLEGVDSIDSRLADAVFERATALFIEGTAVSPKLPASSPTTPPASQ